MSSDQAPTHVHCFDREVLVALSLGRLPDEEAERVAAEVETCPTCRALMDTLDGLEDSVVQAAKELPGSPSPELEPEIEEAIRQAEEISRAVWREGASCNPQGQAGADRSAEVKPPARLGHYDLLERVGRGGMGAVWKAMHVRLKRPVAVKLLPVERMQNAQAVARFQREMEAVGRLDHPNLVRAHDAGEADGQHYLVMEYLDGHHLGQVVRALGPLPVADACEIIRRAAIGLQHAHEHGLVHRDVKPSNVMLTTAGEVKVLDLGLARLTDDQTRTDEETGTGQVMGTGDYIAPEQGQDTRRADARSDVYALGCTLYFLLAGRAPFGGSDYNTFVKKVMAHASVPVPPVQQLRDDLPAGLIAVLERMLAKEPDSRPQTAAEVAESLRTWSVGADLKHLSMRVGTSLSRSDSEAQVETPGGDMPSSPTEQPAAPQLRPRKVLPARTWLWLAILLGCLGGLAAMIAVWIATDRGDLVIRSPDADVQVRVNRSGDEVTVLSGQTEYKVGLRCGEYTLEIVGDDSGCRLSTDRVEIRRGESPLVTITSRNAASPIPARHAPAPMNAFALVQRPASLPGTVNWTIETRGERAAITVMALSPKGDILATGSEVGCVRLWYVATGDLARVWGEPDRVHGLAWSPDGQRLAVAAGTMRLWDPESGELCWEAKSQDDAAVSIAWTAGGGLVSGHKSGLISVRDQETGVATKSLVGHRAAVSALAFTRDGSRLASGAEDRVLRIWEMPAGKPIREIPDAETGPIRLLVWSPEGKRLASCARHIFSVRVESED